jgi:hypothetical protein
MGTIQKKSNQEVGVLPRNGVRRWLEGEGMDKSQDYLLDV